MRRFLAAALVVTGLVVAVQQSAIRGQSSSSDTLFDDSKLHRIDLYVNSRDLYFLKANYGTNDYYPANFRWNGQTVRNVALRNRGYGSRSQAKPGLRVDFNRLATGQTFLGLTSLVLDNLTQDPSDIHEVLAMKLFRRLGLPAPREALAVLYVNNAYSGVYGLVEEPDEVMTTRVFGESAGYLYEYKWLSVYRFEDLGDDLEKYRPIFEPKTRMYESAFNLFEPISAMVKDFNYAFDDEFESKAADRLDLSRFLQHVAAQAYLASWDGLLGYAGLNNFYLYRQSNGRRFQIIPWDEDNAFGPLNYPIDAEHAGNVLMRRLMERPAWRDAFVAAVQAAMASAEEGGEVSPDAPDGVVVNGWMEREIARLQALIREQALADPRKTFTNEEFEQASAALITFAQQRGVFVRAELARLTR